MCARPGSSLVPCGLGTLPGFNPRLLAEVQTLFPNHPAHQSFCLHGPFFTAGGTEHIFPGFKSLHWLPIPPKLRLEPLICPARSCTVGLVSVHPPSSISCPFPYSAGFSHLGWPSFSSLSRQAPRCAVLSAQNSSSLFSSQSHQPECHFCRELSMNPQPV